MSVENRLPAEKRGDLVRCIICGQFSRAIHYHHTVPRSLGGEASLQIPIDGNCHTTLHAKAEATVSRLNGKRREPVGQFWDDPQAEQNAETWLRILVDAMLNPPVAAGQKEILLPMIKVPADTRFALDLLKRDLPGITNMTQVLLYCIEFTLKAKGLRNEKDDEHGRHKGTGKDRNRLW